MILLMIKAELFHSSASLLIIGLNLLMIGLNLLMMMFNESICCIKCINKELLWMI